MGRPDPRAELAQLRTELQAAQALAAAQMDFLADVSHDLRQPLLALQLGAVRLAQLNQDPTLEPTVQQLQVGLAALDGAFAELLDLASLTAGHRAARLQAVELAGLFDVLRQQFGPVAFDLGLALRLRGAHHAVQADPLLLQRLLANLLANALRHTDDGGVLLACRARGPQRLLQVWDSGCGMPAEVVQRIFEPYYQAPRRRGETQHGPAGRNLGLGLTIAQRLASALGRSLTVCSRPGRGSVFSLWLSRDAGVT
jgi:signal transduction histidine kinase